MNRRMLGLGLLTVLMCAEVQSKAENKAMTKCEENKQVIQNLIQEVWRRGRIEVLPRFWTEDCLNHADPAPEQKGLRAITNYHEGFAAWFRDFTNIHIAVQQQIAEGDRVVSQVLLSATHQVSKRPVSLATIRIDRLVEGKIAEHWSVADMAGLAKQLA